MPRRSRRKVATSVLCVFTIIALALDQLAKLVVRAAIPAGDSIRLTRWLYLTPIENTGAAFGLLRGYGTVLAVAAAAAAVVIFVCTKRRGRSRLTSAALGLLLGGALGNLMDRVVRGCVFDFIDLRVWPVFNLADCAITVGVGILIVQMLFPKRGVGC